METVLSISKMSVAPISEKMQRYAPIVPSRWYSWSNVVLEPLEQWQKIEALLGLPHKTIAVWQAACRRALPRAYGWDLSKLALTQRDPYVAAARYYKRGVAVNCGGSQWTLPSMDWLRSYKVYFQQDVVEVSQAKMSDWVIADSGVVSHDCVERLSCVFVLENKGEASKSLATLALILHRWRDVGRPMKWLVYGGGLLLDICGFAACLVGATYTSVPTTLLAMVDASIGGKTAVNFSPFGKNLIGAFYLPESVWIQPKFLTSLSKREYLSGGAECLKHAFLIGDKTLITQVADALKSSQHELLLACLQQLVMYKAQVVRQDPNEQGGRMVLNLGHTLGHALEALSQQHSHDSKESLSHGEAVALGLCYVAILSHHLRYLSKLSSDFMVASLKSSSCLLGKQALRRYLGVVLESESCWEQLVFYLQQDKKQQTGPSRYGQWVLLKDLGQVVYSTQTKYLVSVDYQIAKQCWAKLLTMLD